MILAFYPIVVVVVVVALIDVGGKDRGKVLLPR
jgi:hypothetical protein